MHIHASHLAYGALVTACNKYTTSTKKKKKTKKHTHTRTKNKQKKKAVALLPKFDVCKLKTKKQKRFYRTPKGVKRGYSTIKIKVLLFYLSLTVAQARPNNSA